MPLSPQKQAARRAQRKRLEDPKTFKRKRCDNCGELFRPERAYPVQKFCSGNCRKEFHKNGGNAFGPLKVRLEKLVRSITKQFQLEVEAEYAGMTMRLVGLQQRFTELQMAVTVMDGQLQTLRTANETGAAHKPTPEGTKS